MIALWLVLLSLLAAPICGDESSKRPNVLIILADDVGTGDVPGYWGNEAVDMLNLKNLQASGLTFHNCHSTPWCSPSRYELLSGNYPHRGNKAFSSWGFKEEANQFYNYQKSIAQVLKEEANYHTAMMGKWHLGARAPGSFDNCEENLLTCKDMDWTKKIEDGPNDIGFDESFYTIHGIHNPPFSFIRNGYIETDPSNVTYWNAGSYTTSNGESIIATSGEGDINWDTTQFDQLLVKEANIFLDNHLEKRSEDPFFLYIALGELHKPHSPPDFYADGTPIAGTQGHPQLDCLYEMDKNIGAIISSLETKGLIEDTLIIFTSDNGGLRSSTKRPGRILRGMKGEIYEGGHRVPLVMRYDRMFPKGEVRNSHFVGLNDIYATIADIAQVPIPDASAQDSISFVDYAISNDNTSNMRKYLGVWNKAHRDEAILFKHFKYIRFHFPEKREELYNLKVDIGETNNLLESNPQKYSALRKKLSKKLRKAGLCPLDFTDKPVKLEDGKKKGEKVTCDWFKADPRRCKWQKVGELKCNSICGRFRKYCQYFR